MQSDEEKRIDLSKPDAAKEFEDYNISKLHLLAVEKDHVNGDMAPERPREGSYEYTLDGATGILSSNIAPEIKLNEDDLSEISDFLRDSDIGGLNGIDIWTEGRPADEPSYNLSIIFADGSEYHSRANGADIPYQWEDDGFRLHQLLYYDLLEAGLDANTGEFHSKEPMKRLGGGPDEKPSFSITAEQKEFEKEGSKWNYRVTGTYPVFSCSDGTPKAVSEPLKKLSDRFYNSMLEDMDNDYEMMEGIKAKNRGKDTAVAASGYSVRNVKLDSVFYSFEIYAWHNNSLGVGPYGYSKSNSYHICLDIEKGRILTLSDLFIRPAEIRDIVTKALVNRYGEDYLDYFSSSEFAGNYSKMPWESLLDYSLTDDGIRIRYCGILPGQEKESFYDISLYYDELQQNLNPKYARIW
ncbi:MAG: hypothetical protein IJU50_04825 [Lachnospiraceae bacterium]|nr:hypothetical protein [Lachnospiraceae bacterium]